jgi:hypothetical protein
MSGGIGRPNVGACIASFPATFGLETHRGLTLRIDAGLSGWNELSIVLALDVETTEAGTWVHWDYMTPDVLRASIVAPPAVSQALCAHLAAPVTCASAPTTDALTDATRKAMMSAASLMREAAGMIQDDDALVNQLFQDSLDLDRIAGNTTPVTERLLRGAF